MKEPYVTTNANILFYNETFPHIAQSKFFLGLTLYTSFILRPKFWKYKISTFSQAFLFSEGLNGVVAFTVNG